MRHVCDRNSVGSKASRRDVASLSTTNYAGQNNLGESLRVLTDRGLSLSSASVREVRTGSSDASQPMFCITRTSEGST